MSAPAGPPEGSAVTCARRPAAPERARPSSRACVVVPGAVQPLEHDEPPRADRAARPAPLARRAHGSSSSARRSSQQPGEEGRLVPRQPRASGGARATPRTRGGPPPARRPPASPPGTSRGGPAPAPEDPWRSGSQSKAQASPVRHADRAKASTSPLPRDVDRGRTSSRRARSSCSARSAAVRSGVRGPSSGSYPRPKRAVIASCTAPRRGGQLHARVPELRGEARERARHDTRP